MIKEIDFETIKYYWKTFLWPERYINGREIAPINLEGKQEYFYKILKKIPASKINSLIKPTYAAFFDNERVVGVESGYNTSPTHFRIRGLWVNIHYRNKGTASQLLKYFEEKAKDHKYIWSIPRESALPFYLYHGFEIDGECCNTIYGKTFYVRKSL